MMTDTVPANAEGLPILTTAAAEEIADGAKLDFEPWDEAIGNDLPSNSEWAEQLPLIRLCFALACKPKAQLIEQSRALQSAVDPDLGDNPLKKLVDSIDGTANLLRACLEIVDCAHGRLIVAACNLVEKPEAST